jgi:16S rRNA (guanine966-N2)-methyltransferase
VEDLYNRRRRYGPSGCGVNTRDPWPVTRIIAGAAGGRRLQVPSGAGTRPTSDRAREGLFSTLQSLTDVEGARVLDLYAGSGALGLEALSRGAGNATMVEDDPLALRVVRANVEALGLPGAFVIADKAERFLAGAAEPRYDVALLDPPYELDVVPVLTTLVPWLPADAVVAVERSSRDPELAWPAGFDPVRARRYGEATLWYALRSA